MSPAQPSPRRPSIEDVDLDEVIERIDQSLPAIHRLCRVRRKQKKSPTDRLPIKQAQLMRARFEEMSEDPVVIDPDVEPEQPQRVNGFHPQDEDSD